MEYIVGLRLILGVKKEIEFCQLELIITDKSIVWSPSTKIDEYQTKPEKAQSGWNFSRVTLEASQ